PGASHHPHEGRCASIGQNQGARSARYMSDPGGRPMLVTWLIVALVTWPLIALAIGMLVGRGIAGSQRRVPRYWWRKDAPPAVPSALPAALPGDHKATPI